MSWLNLVTEVLAHAADLIALAVAPVLASPAPSPSSSPVIEAVVATLALAAVVAGALSLRTRLGPKEGLPIAGALVLAVLASVAAAAYFRGARAPIGRGVLFVAVPLWIGLVLTAGAVAERRFGQRLIALGVSAAAGVALFAAASPWLFTVDKMWWDALHKDGTNTTAVDALTRTSMRAHDYPAVLRTLDRCISWSPGACGCLARRADLGIRTHDAERALTDARAAVAACPTDPGARTALAGALAFHGDADQAEQEARTALEQGEDPRLHYALALALQAQAKIPEAMEEAKRAVDKGAGRDAALLLGAMAINAADYDAATAALAPLVGADPGDADAQYDLALVADKKNEYNKARQGYLAALSADPRYADARYNLAWLTARQGVLEEAKHHVQRFAEAFPSDPRNRDLAAMLARATPKPQ